MARQARTGTGTYVAKPAAVVFEQLVGLRVGEAVELRGWLENRRRRLATLRGEARLAESGELVAECSASFMLE